MGRIEQSYKAAVKSIRLAARGKIPEPRNPVITLTRKGFLFGEESRKNAFPVTHNLNTQEDWEVADVNQILVWLCMEYIESGEKNCSDWDAAEELVQKGASFGLLFPWAKPPKRPKVKPSAPEDPQCNFQDMWRQLAAARCGVKTWKALPKSKRAQYEAAGAIAWRLLGHLTVDATGLAKAAWHLWLSMPELPEL